MRDSLTGVSSYRQAMPLAALNYAPYRAYLVKVNIARAFSHIIRRLRHEASSKGRFIRDNKG